MALITKRQKPSVMAWIMIATPKLTKGAIPVEMLGSSATGQKYAEVEPVNQEQHPALAPIVMVIVPSLAMRLQIIAMPMTPAVLFAMIQTPAP